jgi:hypothetical protein
MKARLRRVEPGFPRLHWSSVKRLLSMESSGFDRVSPYRYFGGPISLEVKTMKKSIFGLVAVSAFFLLFAASQAAAQGANASPTFKAPLLITSAGQSPDGQLAAILARRAGVEHTLSPMATVDELAGVGSLGVVVGASLKGLGAAGIDTNREKERVRALIAEAARRNIPVLFFHLGGDQRRGQLTDELVVEYLPAAKWALILKSGNHDGLFTRLAREHGVPLFEVERTADGQEIVKAAFQPQG